ncbi:hypothetical protein ACKWTF_002628 [Chironomus riparius]
MLPQISNLLDSNNFPSLSKRHQVSAHSHPVNAASNSSATFQEEINQQQLINNISYAEKLNEAVKNESLFKKFTEAQERLKRISSSAVSSTKPERSQRMHLKELHLNS